MELRHNRKRLKTKVRVEALTKRRAIICSFQFIKFQGKYKGLTSVVKVLLQKWDCFSANLSPITVTQPRVHNPPELEDAMRRKMAQVGTLASESARTTGSNPKCLVAQQFY